MQQSLFFVRLFLSGLSLAFTLFHCAKDARKSIVHLCHLSVTMIEVLIFHCHILAAFFVFTRRWQEANAKEGILSLALFGLVFTIGWAITGGIAKAVAPENGFTPWFTADTLSLGLVLIPEAVIFRLVFLRRAPQKTVANT